MVLRKHFLVVVGGLLACRGGLRAAEISVADVSIVQGTTGVIVVSGNAQGDVVDGVTIVVELVAQAGSVGTVTFTPAAIPAANDITQLGSPFAGGMFTGEDTNLSGSLARNGSQRDSGVAPAANLFNGSLTEFPIIASADADGVWLIKLTMTEFPFSASFWSPSVATTLVEGTLTATPPFCNGHGDCNDSDPCTDNQCVNGGCQFPYNTLPCDDIDNCTVNDVCWNGMCAGNAVVCLSFSDQCNTASCDPNGTEGNCATLTAVANDTPCDDGLGVCSVGETCQTGTCAGGFAPNCLGTGDQCNADSTCDPAGGEGNCDTPGGSINEGVGCVDGDLCTTSDVCTNGICAGTAPDCTGLNTQCKSGVCDPATGGCIDQPFTDGTACDDGEGCTESDQCAAGVCGGTTIQSCVPCTVPTVAVDCGPWSPVPTNCYAQACTAGVCVFSSNGTCPTLALNADASCYDQGANDIVTVDVALTGLGNEPQDIVAVEFYLTYDAAMLTLLNDPITNPIPTGAPFDFVLQEITSTPGEIDFAVSVNPQLAGGTRADTTVATLTFQTAGQCDPFVAFRNHTPPNQVVNALGASVTTTFEDMEPIRIDGNIPVFSSCQTSLGDINVLADAGDTSAAVTWVVPDASDDCDGSRVVSCETLSGTCSGGDNNGLACSSDAHCTGIANGTCPSPSVVPTGLAGGVFPEGTTTITCRATDACAGTPVGGEETCVFDVTVDTSSELTVDVTLLGVTSSMTRCITFVLSDCTGGGATEIVKKTIGFTNGVANSVSVLVPSGVYTCLTAQDELHTLRSTAPDFTNAGTTYNASFTGANGLRPGDLNNSGYVDVLDFGLLFSQWGSFVSADSDCNTSGVHADFSGDGFVSTADFALFPWYFGQGDQADCCTAGGISATDDGPVLRISLDELEQKGLRELGAADLNRDGWLDQSDITVFLEGAGPSRTPTKTIWSRGARQN